jgi:beta-glucosidase
MLDGSGASVVWNGSAGGEVRISGRAQDLVAPARQGMALDLRFRVNRPPQGAVNLGVRCSGSPCKARDSLLDVTAVFKDAAPGAWHTLVLPLSCLEAAGADLSEVEMPFVLASAGRLDLTLAEVRLHTAAPAQRVCPSSASR